MPALGFSFRTATSRQRNKDSRCNKRPANPKAENAFPVVGGVGVAVRGADEVWKAEPGTAAGFTVFAGAAFVTPQQPQMASRVKQRRAVLSESRRREICTSGSTAAMVTASLIVASVIPARLSKRCAAKQRDEFSTLHSITSSARPSSVIGNVRPSALAVLRLIASSTLVDCCTGRSAGLSPLTIRPTKIPA